MTRRPVRPWLRASALDSAFLLKATLPDPDVPDRLFAAVSDLCPRDDRAADRGVFEGVTADRLRTAITRACTAVGVPAFSPHDLRHRRVTLWHLGGVPAGGVLARTLRAGAPADLRARRSRPDGARLQRVVANAAWRN